MNARQILWKAYRAGVRPLSGHGWGDWPPIARLNRAIAKPLKTVADVQGHKMHVGAHDHLRLFENGIYEPAETAVVRREVCRGDIVVDVGANIGYYTLILANLVGPEGRVFAFEPDPSNFAILQRNVALNGYGNVILEQKAVSNANETLALFVSDDPADTRIYDPGDQRRSCQVAAVRLDDYFGSQQRVDFVKLDIQGAEGKAVSGARETLTRQNRLKVLTEFWPPGLQASGETPEGYIDLLRDLGLRLFRLDEAAQTLALLDIQQPLSSWMATSRSYANLLGLRP